MVAPSAPSEKYKVGLIQINNSFSGQNYLPYSAGLLQAYALKNLKNPGNYEFLLPLYRRMPVEEAVEKLKGVHAAFFSTYVWNIRISLEIARRLKEQRPETVIIFGGPQIPDRIEGFLRKNSFVDIAAHGEGERVFLSLLENLPEARRDRVPSISYLREGLLVQTPKIDRLKDLSSVPSPYLEKVFDPLMQANPQEKWIVLWETNRGCPFSCTFCDWGSAVASKVFAFDLDRLRRETDWFADNKIEFIFCADANFGILPRDLDIVRHVADVKSKRGFPHALSVQNTKNATERAYQVQSILAQAGLNKGVAISLQSTDPETLKAIKRDNISLKSYAELQRRFTRDGVETYSDMILGMPGETYDSFARGVADLIQGGQHNRIQFNNLSILPNAEMGDPEYQAKYGMETVESKIINVHGSLAEEEEVSETQELVIATRSMPREEWVRTRAFSWMAAFLYFDKVLQIPLTVLHESCGAGYRELIELFSEGDLRRYPILSEIQAFFREEGRKIQQGGPEYVQSKKWLNIWWPADEYILIKLCTENRIDAFYAEAERALEEFLAERFTVPPAPLLHEAMLFNCSLLKRPFLSSNLELELSYNHWEFYQSVLRGTPIALELHPTKYRIDRTSQKWSTWEDWCREVVWYGNKKGAYLYGTIASASELAGHY
jgi:radical SAM superfamily enzyme YgiQ (UPF0313 family)